MKKSLFALIIALSMSSVLLSQEEEKKEEEPKFGWKKEVIGSLNLTQTSFDNWARGGENSLSWQLNLNSVFIKNEKKYNWANFGKITYGRVKVGDNESRKSIDEIKLESIYSFRKGLYINPYIRVSAETQFTKGYRYTGSEKAAISDFFDPVYFTQGVGIVYSPDDRFVTHLGMGLKETLADDYPVPYSDNPETLDKIEKTKVELGVESVTDFGFKIAKNILMTSNLELFSNMKAFNEIDVRWDTIVAAKVAKYVDVNFNVKLFYDRDISQKRQIKQSLALGLTYSFL